MVMDGDFQKEEVLPRSSGNGNAKQRREEFRKMFSKSVSMADSTDEPMEPQPIQIKKDNFLNYYSITKELGRGRFGVVNKCQENATGAYFASKHIKMRPSNKQLVRHEIDILSSIRHKRIVQLHDVYEEAKQMVLVLELVSGGELFEKLAQEDLILEDEAVFFVKQILEGVECLHQYDILHLDLKPENIVLVDENSLDIKLIDFGLAKRAKEGHQIKVLNGTPEFSAPEVINYEEVTKATDMWSVGVITYVLLSGISPFLGEDKAETCSNVTKSEWDFDHSHFDQVSEDAKDFIRNLMVNCPRDRLTATECLEHPWIKNLTRERRPSKIHTKALLRFTRSYSMGGSEEGDSPRSLIPRTLCPDDQDIGNRCPSPVSEQQEKAAMDESETIKVDVNANIGNSNDETPNEGEITPKNELALNEGQDLAAFRALISNLKQKDMYESMERLNEVERECARMERKLYRQNELQQEIESLKEDMESTLETHKILEESILSFEQSNSSLQDRCKAYSEEIKILMSDRVNFERTIAQKDESYRLLQEKYTVLQEKLDEITELKETVKHLTTENSRKQSKVDEMENRLMTLDQRGDSRRDEEERTVVKFEKENKSLQQKISEYLFEIEDLELKLDNAEDENDKLLLLVEELRKTVSEREKNTTSQDEDSKLHEFEKKVQEVNDLLENLKNEKMELLEELNKLKADSEKPTQALEKENRSLHSLLDETKTLLESSRISCAMLNDDLQSTKSSHAEVTKELKEKVSIKDLEIENMEKKVQELNDEVNKLMKSQCLLVEERLNNEKGFKERIADLEMALEEFESHRKLLEKEHQDRLATTSERELALNNKVQTLNKELEKATFELKVARDHLRIATDKNSELQVEVTRLQEVEIENKESYAKLKDSAEKELRDGLEQLERSLKEKYENELEDVKHDLSERQLEIQELRSSSEKLDEKHAEDLTEAHIETYVRPSSAEESFPIHTVLNGNIDKDYGEEPGALDDNAQRHYSDTEAMKRKAKMNATSTTSQPSVKESEDLVDNISDRELRRISFRIAEGNWAKLGPSLGVSGREYEKLLGMSLNAQEKVFRLLVSWREQSERSRNELIVELIEALERQKRKDVVRFLKDLSQGGSSGGGGIKKRFRSIVRN